jgi:hypothetical protein
LKWSAEYRAVGIKLRLPFELKVRKRGFNGSACCHVPLPSPGSEYDSVSFHFPMMLLLMNAGAWDFSQAIIVQNIKTGRKTFFNGAGFDYLRITICKA